MTELHDPPVPRTKSRARTLIAPTGAPLPAEVGSTGLLIDAHVHIHERFDPGYVLEQAARNFAHARRGLACTAASAPGCLLLAENPLDDVFHALTAADEVISTRSKQTKPWRIEDTSESCSLICSRESDDGKLERIIVIAGRQIIVRERLEVLALCCKSRFPMGRSLKWTLEESLRAGAVTVIPWGFGKWRFRRGTLVRKVLESGFCECVYLGDNGNRLALSPVPALFKLAAERNVRILPGSDPLPMRGRECDAGRYGFLLSGEADIERPALWIKSTLRDRASRMQRFGTREGAVRFCISQLAMQLRRS